MLSWRDRYLEKLKDKIKNAQRRRSGEKAHHIYETYKNTVIPHGHHIYAKSCDMENAKYAHILSLIMQFHTGNVYYGVVTTVHISIFLTKKQIKNMKKKHPQYSFTFITSLCVVLPMVESHQNIEKYVTCINKNIHQINLQKYTPENS